MAALWFSGERASEHCSGPVEGVERLAGLTNPMLLRWVVATVSVCFVMGAWRSRVGCEGGVLDGLVLEREHNGFEGPGQKIKEGGRIEQRERERERREHRSGRIVVMRVGSVEETRQ